MRILKMAWNTFKTAYHRVEAHLSVERIGLVVAVGLLVATGYNTYITRQDMILSERAFLYHKELSVAVFPHKPREQFNGTVSLIIKFGNSGETPARKAVPKVDFCLREGGPPKDFSYPLKAGLPSLLVSPKGDAQIAISLPNSVLSDTEAFKSVLVVYGQISYMDIFDTEHRTQFCEQMTGYSTNANGIIVHFNWMNCEQHNCHDGDCPEQWGKPGVECCSPKDCS